ncbi:hypothetical protein [Streptomyces niveus]|uniref:hypothetical protein n=1 Tax=Streptomyces niveus TaxID=193462 RepID=UPI00367CCC02
MVEQQTRGQFTIGDRALEIEPLRKRGGQQAGDPEWSVNARLTRLAEDIGLKFNSVKSVRRVASGHGPFRS